MESAGIIFDIGMKSLYYWIYGKEGCYSKVPMGNSGAEQHWNIKELMMCDPKEKCEKPENLKTTPEECTPEQIKKCHGEAKGHPCADEQEGE
jgi:hypothetical protein